jgi:hypothetical protein
MASKIFVNSIYMEDLFKWAYGNMMDSCGDGWAYIICSNPQDVSQWLYEYIQSQSQFRYRWTITNDNPNMIYISDNQEGITITNNKILELSYNGDYIFIVEKDCVSRDTNKVVKAI